MPAWIMNEKHNWFWKGLTGNDMTRQSDKKIPLTVLHTSDWHLGRSLYGRRRYDEFEAFLSWLAETIRQRQVDVLLVSGDIFDTTTPSNKAQELYYRFLCEAAASSCRHVVITAGNHDSPSFLEAPKTLLKVMNVHVIGSISDQTDDEVLVLHDSVGEPELIVCAVPYLRDRDIRLAEAGESLEDKERKLVSGIREHYAQVTALALEKRYNLQASRNQHNEDNQHLLTNEASASTEDLPIICMGHLFTAGGKTAEGDGVRELYVGSLAHVTADIFSENFAYVALGHLHIAQKIAGKNHMRYCGSPLPMGFGEASQQKSVCEIKILSEMTDICQIQVPVFQKLVQIRGDLTFILIKIQTLSQSREPIWLEIIYDGVEVVTDLREKLEAAIEGQAIEILRIKNNRLAERALEPGCHDEKLDDLTPADVFQRCLDAHQISPKQRPLLMQAYNETVAALLQEDQLAE